MQCPAVDITVHELGHVLGAEHDPDHTGATTSTASFPYSFGYGYRALGTGFETIMAQRFYVEPTNLIPGTAALRTRPNLILQRLRRAKRMPRCHLLMRSETPAPNWSRCRELWFAGLCALFLQMGPAPVWAQQTQGDLSVSATVTPPYFVPGGRNTVELTVHNAGPDAVDSGAEFSISVFGDSYVITHSPPPYEVLMDTVQGCWAERFIIELVPPNNDNILLFAYDFDALPAGASLTCTYDIEFYPSTTAPFTLEWWVDTSGTGFSIDPNPSNNTFSYTLNAAPFAPPVPVPAGSPRTWLLLVFGIVFAAGTIGARGSAKQRSRWGGSLDYPRFLGHRRTNKHGDENKGERVVPRVPTMRWSRPALSRCSLDLAVPPCRHHVENR